MVKNKSISKKSNRLDCLTYIASVKSKKAMRIRVKTVNLLSKQVNFNLGAWELFDNVIVNNYFNNITKRFELLTCKVN